MKPITLTLPHGQSKEALTIDIYTTHIRFPLSLRNVEDLLHERGIDICHESIRLWGDRFGKLFAKAVRKRRSQTIRQVSQWRWHLDEMFVRIASETHCLWRAVDHEGEVLEAYVTKARDKAADLKFLKKAMKRYGNTKIIVTDGLASYGAAFKEIGNEGKGQFGRYLKNRAENSHLPFRGRERAMLRFRLMRGLQTFAATHASVYNHFNLDRHLAPKSTFKAHRDVAPQDWRALVAA